MAVTVRRGDPRDPQATALLRASQALMQALFPPEDNFFLDIDALAQPDIAFFVAVEGEVTLGTAAYADKGDYGEVKSMFVSPEARGKGVAGLLMAALETEARAKGHAHMRLETGDALHAAHRVYERAGFTYRGPFGDYPDAKSSLFMEKAL